MSEDQGSTATTEAPAAEQGPPKPHPALKRLDRLVGTWDMTGRTLNSDTDNVKGRTTFEWLPGGFFLQQRFHADFAGYDIQSLEVIWYDPETDTFPSTVYASMAGTPLPYRYEVNGDNLKITAETLNATFHGNWKEDGTFSGGWRPDPGHENDPGNVAYDIWGSRAK